MPFAGYDMPVQNPAGILAEHLHTRAAAGLFDVSHMGQVESPARGAAGWRETLVPGDIVGLGRATPATACSPTPQGGILDDLMVSRLPGPPVPGGQRRLQAGRHRPSGGAAFPPPGLARALADRALLALQGPGAAGGDGPTWPRRPGPWASCPSARSTSAGIPCLATRSGYTGEDG